MFTLMYHLYTWSLGFAITAILFHIVSIAMFVFSIIGIVATIKWFAGRKKGKDSETPGEYWRRTGRIK